MRFTRGNLDGGRYAARAMTTLTVVAVVAALTATGGVAAAATSTSDGGTSDGGTSGVTRRISVSSHGEQGNGESVGPTFSADGRYVVFSSTASNLVPDTAGGGGLYLRDRRTGTTTLIYGASGGGQVSITPNGRYIAFVGGSGFVVRDLWTGAETDELAGNFGYPDFDRVGPPQLSADGRLLVFSSTATNLVAEDTNNVSDVFLRDRRTGTTTRVSVSSTGEQANDQSWSSSMTADGRYVAFTSHASNLVPGDTNDTEADPYDGGDAFVRDLRTDRTTRVSVSTAGVQTDGLGSLYPVLSANGRYVAFQCWTSTLIPGDDSRETHIYLRDRWAATTERISVSSDGVPADNSNWEPQISADGRHISYYSYASNLVRGDTNGVVDVFLRDRRAATTTRVSVTSSGAQANGWSLYHSMTADGRSVAFQSDASNLVRGDTNDMFDVFIRDLRH
jgi:Tol biopolymer transport system component